MTELRFTKDHEWVHFDGDTATVGITDHAQQALGDVVFVELPEPGRDVAAEESIAVVESARVLVPGSIDPSNNGPEFDESDSREALSATVTM